MSDFPWLTTLGVIPLVGAAVVAALPKGRDVLAKQVALAFALVTLGVTIAMATQFDADGSGFQFVESHDWIEAFGVKYAVGVDGIALVLVALATILVPVCILAGWREVDEVTAEGRGSVKGYFALVLVLETMMIGVFAATDLFLFYVFFEAMLIPMYFIIGRYGGAQRSYAAMKFLLYSLFGGLIMLVALLALWVQSGRELGERTFDFTALVGLDLDPTMQKWLFLGFFFAFAVKAPMVPFHTWLPDAASQSTPAGAVLLVGVLDKVGTFGMLRYCLPIFPDAASFYAPFIITLAVISIFYGALLALGQTDLMRLIAYTSISHFGFIVLGIFAFTTQAQAGSTLYMVNHGFSTAALFLFAGYLIQRRGSQQIADFGGVQRVAPKLAGIFLVAALSSLALPGLAPFVSEFLVLVGTFTRYPWVAAIATLGIILAALYMLVVVQRVTHGPTNPEVSHFTDLRPREAWAAAPVVAVIVVLGFFPQPLLAVINPAVGTTLEHAGKSDPAPTTAEGRHQ